MQETFTSIPHWIQLALTAVASILSTIGIDRLYNNWLNRNKPAAEIEVSQATAAEITVRASSSASEAVMRMMDRLNTAQGEIDRLRTERDDWRSQALEAKALAENAVDDAKTARMFTDQLNAAAKLTICEHYPNGVRLSDYTPRQLNPGKE
jgi:Tfp pilus assembly major pilin PilA